MSDEENIPEPEVQTLPLDAWHRAKGARMVEFAGYHMPIQYEGIMAEHQWTRENAGLFDVSHMGQLQIAGDGAVAALEKILPGDIAALKPGRMRYSLLLAEDGGILDDLMVTNAGDHIYMVVNGATKWDDIAYLRENLPDEVTLNYMDEAALVALQGPKAVEVLARLVQGVRDLVFMQSGAFDWNGVSLWVSRSGYTGEDGFEISVPAAQVEAFADALTTHPEVKPIGLGARDSLRLEAGLPLYGHDVDATIDPVEADVTFAINKRRREEGDFAGAGRILPALANGTKRKRVGFAVDGRQPVREGAKIYLGDAEVGVITSGGFAPTVGAPIAMGYVATPHASEGTKLEADVRGKRIGLTVAPMPFVPHKYVRKAG